MSICVCVNHILYYYIYIYSLWINVSFNFLVLLYCNHQTWIFVKIFLLIYLLNCVAIYYMSVSVIIFWSQWKWVIDMCVVGHACIIYNRLQSLLTCMWGACPIAWLACRFVGYRSLGEYKLRKSVLLLLAGNGVVFIKPLRKSVCTAKRVWTTDMNWVQ